MSERIADTEHLSGTAATAHSLQKNFAFDTQLAHSGLPANKQRSLEASQIWQANHDPA